MTKLFRFLSSAAVVVSLVSLGAGCDGGGGGGGNSAPDVGDNDINTVLCVGDSITDGECVPAGAPYPSRLGGLTGKRVVNAGACGEKSGGGAERIGGLLARHKPGYVCILYGANDAIFDRDIGNVDSHLRTIVQACLDNKSVPIIATLTPLYDGHAFARGSAREISADIRGLAKEMGARLADLENEFGSNRDFIQDDGLHPSDSGTQLIALTFNDRI